MTQINSKSFKIEVKSPESFTIGDTRQFSPYSEGGVALEVKVPVYLRSYPLDKSLSYPYAPGTKELPIASWEKFGVPEQLHVILDAVLSFHAKYNRLPTALSADDTQELKVIVKQKLEQMAAAMEIEGEETFKVSTVD